MPTESATVRDCPFCKIIRGESPARMVFQDDEVLAFFPSNPATLGHTLVVPRRHVRDLWGLEKSDAAAVGEATMALAHAVRASLDPDGLNLITSAGEAATQSVFHLHVHVVPRWEGDSIGDIWPPKEPIAPNLKDEALEELQEAWADLRRWRG